MEYIILQSFTNYIEAHLLLTHLESEDVECWLQDENTVTLYPIWTNAVGGIKLMVNKEDYPRALEIFKESEKKRKEAVECPKCKGHNVEEVSSPRKPANWISAIFTYSFMAYPLGVDKVNHCFDCGHEFANSSETNTSS